MSSSSQRNLAIFLTLFYNSHFAAIVEGTVSDERLANVSLRLYLGNDVSDANYLTELVADADKLLQKFDRSKPTVFYVHGYHEHLHRKSIQAVVGAYLKRNDHNVVAADWSDIASENYFIVAGSAEKVGKTLANALNLMVKKGHLDPEKLHVVAHSLGGQVAGFIGRNVDFKLRRITALDPAGPGFNLIITSLSSKDARFVDIIHTDSGIYGNGKEAGTADFYPNGGTRLQPGCPVFVLPLSDDDFCSHQRSWVFYAESVTNENAFTSVKCKSRFQFQANKCKDNDKVPMGFATPFGTKGAYYLETNDRSPFGKGDDGVKPKKKSLFG